GGCGDAVVRRASDEETGNGRPRTRIDRATGGPTPCCRPRNDRRRAAGVTATRLVADEEHARGHLERKGFSIGAVVRARLDEHGLAPARERKRFGDGLQRL